MAQNYNTTPDPVVVDKLVRQIVDLVHPVGIVLFGSAANGTMGPGSDIDLMVVMPQGANRRETSRRLYSHRMGVKVPYDILVSTMDDLERYGKSIGLIYKEIIREGKVLYGEIQPGSSAGMAAPREQ